MIAQIRRRLLALERLVATIASQLPAALTVGGSGGNSMVAVKITSGTASDEYRCDVYAQGRYTYDPNTDTKSANSATVSNAKLIVIQVGATQSIPVDTWMLAVDRGNYYETDVTRII